MKKLLLTLAILLIAAPAWGTVYYGGAASKNINGDDLWCTAVTGSCACDGSPTAWTTVNAAGNTIVANGCTIAIPNTENVTVSVDKVSNKETDTPDADCVDGGGYTYVTAADYALTINSAIEGTSSATTPCITVTGSAAGTKVTVTGNITGGGGTAAYGLYLNNTVGNVVLGQAGTPITITGGIGSNAHAVHFNQSATSTIYANAYGGTNVASSATGISNGTGAMTFTGSCTGGAASSSHGCYSNASGAVSITGDCTGSDSAPAVGCVAIGTGTMTIVGNLINGDRGTGAGGKIVWNPTAPANGVTGHYIKFDGTGDAVYCGKNTDDASKALTTFYYIDPTDGTSDQGSASAGGGGAWGF